MAGPARRTFGAATVTPVKAVDSGWKTGAGAGSGGIAEGRTGGIAGGRIVVVLANVPAFTNPPGTKDVPPIGAGGNAAPNCPAGTKGAPRAGPKLGAAKPALNAGGANVGAPNAGAPNTGAPNPPIGPAGAKPFPNPALPKPALPNPELP